MQTQKTHWASVLTLILIGTSLLFVCSIALLLMISSFMDLAGEVDTAASSMISAFAFGFIGFLLSVCTWFILEKVRGLEKADAHFELPFPTFLWAVIPFVVFTSVLVGGLVTLVEMQWLNLVVLPGLTILVIGLPIWLLFRIASQGIALGPRWRFFAVFSLSMTVAPFIMVLLEMLVLGMIVIGGVVYIAVMQPELFSGLETMALNFNETISEEVLFTMLAPYITNPYLIGIGIGYIALIVPLIEELFKPLAVWFLGRRIASPGQGFVLGALSGAAFALFESLNASADGSTTWAVIVSVRTGTSVLHMMTSGLVGWGIACLFLERRYGRFAAAYVSAVLIHGIWNASAVGMGLASLGESVGRPEWLFTFGPALVCGLMTLAVGIVAVLFASNRKLRA